MGTRQEDKTRQDKTRRDIDKKPFAPYILPLSLLTSHPRSNEIHLNSYNTYHDDLSTNDALIYY